MDEAVQAFRAELDAFSQNREAYTRLAVLLVAIGREQDAESVLEEMFAKNRSRESAQLAAETWRVVDNPVAANRWQRRAAGFESN